MNPLPTRLRSPLAPAAGATVVVAAALLFAPAGCGPSTPDTSAAANTTADRPAEDPWPRAANGFRRETDTATARRVLSQLNTDLAVNPTAEQPDGLSADAAAKLEALVPLAPPEVDEIRQPTYSGLDGHHVAQAFYLRDAARSLGTPADPAAAAQEAFDWVCRQVELRPWLLAVGQDGRTGRPVYVTPALPPAAVLRRGSGSGLERAYVLLALAHQLNLDAVLVGPPAAADQPACPPFADPKSPPRGPFWAVGVKAGKEILLFDPWRGEPVPGPGGKGVGTLAQVTADPNQLKPWADDKANPWDVPLDTVKASTGFLAVPLSALAPRLQKLEDKLSAEAAVRLTVDPAALQTRLAEAGLPGAKAWGRPDDRFAYTRALHSYLPLDEGGADRGTPPDRVADRYQFALLPRTLIKLPPELTRDEADRARYGDALNRLFGLFAARYTETFLTPPTPREKVQRGQYNEATRALVEARKEYEAAAARVRSDRNREAAVGQWLDGLRQVYDQLSKARLSADPAAVPQAERAVAGFWTAQAKNVGPLVDAAVADTGVAEATYLLALAKHEQAERTAARSAGAAEPRAADAWAAAKDWWDRYQPYAAAQDAAFPGRAAHARRLADRAAAGAAR